MGSLFSGTPQTATSYTTSTSETPKWLQDAIFNQIQWSQNISNMPYQAYTGTLVAPTTEQQKQAYQGVTAAQGAAQPAMQQALAGTQALAGQTSVGNIAQYMNPYQQNVLDVMARQSARNLQENLLPAVSDQFIRAGQFGSSRMGEFGARAVRDTQEALLNQQAQALQSGYGQALGASQADLARQQSALAQSAAQAQAAQQQRYTDIAALEAAGQTQQAQAQREAEAAYQQYLTQLNYPKEQLNFLSAQVRGLSPYAGTTQTQAGTSTGQTYSQSPLSQLASAGATGAALWKLSQGL